MQVIYFGLGIIFNLLHGGSVVLEGLVALGLHPDDLLAQHAHAVLLVRRQLLALPLKVVVLRPKQRELSRLLVDLAAQGVHKGFVGQSCLFPLGMGRGKVLVVLRL
jgi:hypothetical protein